MTNGISAMFERKAEENRLECNPHPEAPHGFDRTSSHTLDRYVCECEGWTPEPADMVNHPPHYTSGGVECIEAIEAAVEHLDGFEAYCTGNAIKYLWRWKLKNGKQDLEKAVFYINRLIDGV